LTGRRGRRNERVCVEKEMDGKESKENIDLGSFKKAKK